MKLLLPLLSTLVAGACLCTRPLGAQPPPAGEAPPPQAPAQTAAEEVNLDFFYTNLQDKGDWLQTQEYGYVFRPTVGTKKADWRPYTDGYWAHTDEGWLWNSYEDFGWATYHYGRWTRLKEYGWVWVPGYEWAPAWVAWRGSAPDGSDAKAPRAASRARNTSVQTSYVGWAPLPPEAVFDQRVGFNSAVDYQYALTPDEYNFVPVQSFGDPYLAPLIIAPLLAYGFWASTYGYTNYCYTNYGWGSGVYAGGPYYGYYSGYSARPINQYYIQRNLAFSNGGVNNFRASQPVNGVIPVFAPRVAQTTPASGAALKPATVAAVVPAGQVQRGWAAAKGNPAAVEQAKAVVKTQAASAKPVTIPNAQQRTAGLVAPPGGVPRNLAPTNLAPTNATVPNAGAPMPNAAVVPKNQLSPQNAAKVQANQTAKGLPATVRTAPAVMPKTGPTANQVGPKVDAVKGPATTTNATNAAKAGGAKGAKPATENAVRSTSSVKKPGNTNATRQNTSANRQVTSQPKPQAQARASSPKPQAQARASAPRPQAQARVSSPRPQAQARASAPKPQAQARSTAPAAAKPAAAKPAKKEPPKKEGQ